MKDYLVIGLLLLLAALALSANIWGYSIYLLDEAKNAECAREMLETGNWVVPTFNYEIRTDKPPLHYYFMAFAYSIFGVNAFAARLFSVVFGMLTLLLTYHFTKIHAGEKVATYVSLVLLSSIGFILQFHMAVPDPYLVFFITAALYSFYHGIQRSDKKWLVIGYVSIGLAILTKGPVGFVIPCLVIILYFLIFRRDEWHSLHMWLGLVVIITISFPWFVMVAMETDGEWLKEFFIDHNIERFISPKEGHGGNLILIPVYFILMSMPLGIFFLPAMVKTLKRPFDELPIFCLIVTLVVIIIFSFSATKLPNYVSPALPFASIIVGKYLSESKSDIKRLMPWVMILLIVSITVPVIITHINSDLILSSDWRLFIGLPAGALIGLVLVWKKKLQAGILFTGLSSILTMVVLFYTLVPRIDQQNPVRLSLGQIHYVQNLTAYHIFNPAFSFYLRKKIEVFADKTKLQTYLDQNEDVVVLTRSNVLSDLKKFNLDTVLVQSDLFEQTKTAVLKERNQNNLD